MVDKQDDRYVALIKNFSEKDQSSRQREVSWDQAPEVIKGERPSKKSNCFQFLLLCYWTLEGALPWDSKEKYRALKVAPPIKEVTK